MPDSAPPGPSLEAESRESVTRRDLHFDLDGLDIRHWHPEGPHVAHFFNALSLTFPEGERFFIESVRAHRAAIEDPQLLADVRGFIGQEAMHGREHDAWNEKIKRAGLPADRIRGHVKRNTDLARRMFSDQAQLAMTMALEHYTAEMADQLLTDPRLLGDADPRARALWRWHAMEETEHKAVAFDVYRAAYGDTWSAWWKRTRLMWMVTIEFWLHVFVFHVMLVRADGGGRDWRGWLRALRYLWVRPAPMLKVPGVVWRYCRRGFHPWQKDNRSLIADWQRENAADSA